MKLCSWAPAKTQQEHPEFMEQVVLLKIKEKATASASLHGASVATSSPAAPGDGQLVKVEATDPSHPPHDGQLTMQWAMIPMDKKKERKDACHNAWDLFFFVHNVPFSLIETPEFKAAIAATKRCPTYKPVTRDVLSGPHLDKQSRDAIAFNDCTLAANLKYGFVITGDGYRSKTKRQYHNFMLITPDGPVFLGIKDVTGEGGTSKDVFDEFHTVIESLDTDVKNGIMLGILDTPSVNVKAWKLLMKHYPTQVWMGCMAHEVSLFFNDIAKLPATARLKRLCHYLVKWIMNHTDILALFRAKVAAHFAEIKQAATTKQDRSLGCCESRDHGAV